MIISQETIQAVQRVARIEEVVADFLPLKKKGQNFWACCPFHDEHTPSFSVSSAKGFYKCFGCDASGDIITFIQQIEGSTFIEAITYLAQRYGIPITSATDGAHQDYQAKESLYILLNAAKDYYINLLWHHEEAAKVALTYLAQRAIPSEIAKKFELGYSLDSWDAFYRFAIGKGVRLEQLVAAGLVVQNGTKVYDRFRGRLMFPIHNSSGQVVAFGARHIAIAPLAKPISDGQFLGETQSPAYSAVCEERRDQNGHLAIESSKRSKEVDGPKYINSSETLIYQKGRLLYGLSFAKHSIKQENNCYLVEGYTDVLAFHKAGVEQVVASAGTALTEPQIDALCRFTTKVTLVFDGDQAGIQAAFRGIDKFLAKGFEVKVILLPSGEDPDGYLRKVGTDAFNHYINCSAQDFITFKASFLLNQSTEQTPVAQARAIREIVQSVVAIPDEIEGALFLKKCSKLFAIEEELLFTTYHALRHATTPVWQQKRTFPKQYGRQKSNPYIDQKNLPLTSKLTASIEAYEREIMRVLLTYGATKLSEERWLYQYIFLELGDVAFRSTDCKVLFEYCKSVFQQGGLVDMQCCLDSKEETIRKIAIDLTASPHDISEAWIKKYGIYTIEEGQHAQKISLEVILRLKIRLVQELIEQNRETLKQELSADEEVALLQVHQLLKASECSIAKQLGTVVAQ
ncbi:MAG: CHC2 zinc finger domain-containing protein [Candidatus Cardinium sp.]|uniref:DNA primase n=1 Tax=Cardinium endosymbiont of Dermatophagoides farinae TaxID=2597823 RepID=UPI001183A90F|nr:CHC2 zinc finger domain-containing protein [Cardinium endosymbiont of Dermatophagoides farinae]TSJ80526.1 toprim domain-containing protein [Cardinium endosymbiont of Dermatophagoides farinae]UWW96493.1 MAG: CHC2 zinc finger domain-containing protein [Candidatus Cardinium sp.]